MAASSQGNRIASDEDEEDEEDKEDDEDVEESEDDEEDEDKEGIWSKSFKGQRVGRLKLKMKLTRQLGIEVLFFY